MSRWTLLLLLAGCTGEVVETDTDATDTDPADTDVAEVRPDLPILPEAEDLDPADDVVKVRLVAAPHTFTIGEDTVEGYAYNGAVPGPTIRAKVGDTIVAEIVNDLDVPTTVHWHGADTPYEVDGVTWTEAPIAPGETFTATFPATHAGTFWYHPHFDTERQVDLGLYGALVIEDPAEPAVDHDVVVIADAWGEHDARTPPEGANHHGLDGADLRWTLNGVVDPILPVQAGETVRLRLIDAANTGYLDLRPTEGVRFIASDQGLWPGPATGRHLVGPGDRIEAEIAVGTTPEGLSIQDYSLYGGTVGNGQEAARLDVIPEGAGPAPTWTPWPFPEIGPSADPGRTDLRFVLQGDATDDAWYINGEVFPDVTVPVVPQGADVIVEVRNISPTDHPFHMHGHPFEVLSLDGEPVDRFTLEDTVNVGIRQTLRARFTAVRPGSWMTHCHILPHADGGMMTVVDVVE